VCALYGGSQVSEEEESIRMVLEALKNDTVLAYLRRINQTGKSPWQGDFQKRTVGFRGSAHSNHCGTLHFKYSNPDCDFLKATFRNHVTSRHSVPIHCTTVWEAPANDLY
jgi:hypothetical protein